MFALGMGCSEPEKRPQQNAKRSAKAPAEQSAVKRCKEECRQGFEKYMKKNPEQSSFWIKTFRDCKTLCEKDPTW